jgi:TPP-dependent pyruvate/acetoin dehydrogenase alpha subunit
MRSIDVDGQDVEAVYNATREAREHAVSGQGPVFLNVRTYRLVGHYIGDPQVYREKSEIEDLRETRDPITLLRTRLDIGDEEFEALDTETEALIEAAVEFAKAGTDPRPEDALKYVYA